MSDQPIPVERKPIAPLPSISEFFRHGITRYRSRWSIFLQIAFVTNSPSVLALIISRLPSGGLSTVVLLPLLLVGLVWGTLAMYASVALPNETTNIQQAFIVGGRFFLNSLTTGILTGLWVLLGLILLIIPGIYWGVLYSLTAYLVFRERLVNQSALKRSKELVRPRWVSVFIRLLIIGILGGVLSFVFTGSSTDPSVISHYVPSLASDILDIVYTIVVMPVSVIVAAVMYDHLTNAGKNSA